jgi:hypothetical protein
VITTIDIRRWATALPEVQETSHFRFQTPIYKVRGKTFVGMGRDEATAVFCISEEQAARAAESDPASCAAVRRMDARRSFLGLEVRLGPATNVSQIRQLVVDAWRHQAPKRLVAEFDRST